MIGRWTVVNGILVAIVLALGVQITRTWMRTLPPTSQGAGSEAAEPAGRGDRARAKREKAGDAKSVVAAIAAKDLFDPTRSGTASPGDVAAATPEEPPAPPGVVVVGVRLIGPDAEAVVEDTAKGKEQRRVRTGDAVGDYTVQEIRESSVVLTAASGESVTLWLELGAGSATAAKPAVPPRLQPAPAAPATTAQPARGGGARRAAQRAARRAARERRARQGAAELPEGVRERLEALRRNR